jgi:hypothetical protein
VVLATSQHCKGEAMDIDMDGKGPSNAEIFHYIKENLNFDQLIWEFGSKTSPDWVHVSYKKGGPKENKFYVLKEIQQVKLYTNLGNKIMMKFNLPLLAITSLISWYNLYVFLFYGTHYGQL